MKVVFLRQAYRFVRRANEQLRMKIKEEILRIQKDPKIGKQLSGKLRGMKSHHFSYTGTQYRVLYTGVDTLIVVVIGTRENFYKNL